MGQAEIEGPRLVDALFSGRGPSGDARASETATIKFTQDDRDRSGFTRLKARHQEQSEEREVRRRRDRRAEPL